MKKVFFFVVFAMFHQSLFAQSIDSDMASVQNETSQQSLVVQNATLNAPDKMFKTQGEPWDKGFFMDLIVGTGSMTYSRPSVPNLPGGPSSTRSVWGASLRLGNKWYFGSSEKFKPGIQAVWARLGVVNQIVPIIITNNNNPLLTPTTVTFAPLNIGSTNLIMFNDKIGLEANFNIGLNSNFTFIPLSTSTNQTLMQFGVSINPNVKFRYKKFAVGIDLTYTHSPAPGTTFESNRDPVPFLYETGVLLVGLTIGLKF